MVFVIKIEAIAWRKIVSHSSSKMRSTRQSTHLSAAAATTNSHTPAPRRSARILAKRLSEHNDSTHTFAAEMSEADKKNHIIKTFEYIMTEGLPVITRSAHIRASATEKLNMFCDKVPNCRRVTNLVREWNALMTKIE